MTCIVGIASEGKVCIGGDRGISNESVILPLSRPKVYKRDKWIFGYSGSVGTGQLIEFVNLPEVGFKDPYAIIRIELVPIIRDAIESFGSSDADNAADFLIGYDGRLFELSTEDWGVLEIEESSIGTGSIIALGSLYTTRYMDMNIEERVTLALDAAIELSPGCAAPVDILWV